jgi:8-oxo-dGTP pyrophosphatase MutT (NUDIX family)
VTRLRARRGVIGVISRGAAYLMVRRAPNVAKGGYWCFPGGHVEAGETSRRANQRELAEELGIGAVPGQRLGAIRIHDGDYVLAVWEIEEWTGRLTITEDEVAEARWLTPAQIRAVRPNLASNEEVLKMLGA